MLTGRAPFKSGSTLETAMAHLKSEVLPPRAVRAGVPREIEAVVLRAMSKDRDARYQSAQEMASALEGMAEDPFDRTDPAMVSDPGAVTVHQPGPVRGTVRGTATVVPGGRSDDGFLKHEGRTLGLTLLVVLLAAVAVIAGLVLFKPDALRVVSGNNDKPKTTTTVALAGVKASAIGTVDPADGAENNDMAPRATDGDQATFWRTDRYNTAQFGNLKEGLGLVIDAGSIVKARELQVDLAAAGGRAEVRAATDTSGNPADWQVVGSARNLGERTTFQLKGDQGYRWYMLWITELPDGPKGGYQARVGEVRLRAQAQG
jgi:hypothetical protein